MAELLKNIYNNNFFEEFSNALKSVVPHFNKESFINQILDKNWNEKELKQRMRHITIVLKQHLYNDFNKNVNVLTETINHLKRNGINGGLEYIIIPDFIEVYGLDDYPTSIKAIEEITQFITCEFAIRPFIIKYENELLKQMLQWSKHNKSAVRRLASEGCRPRLPWAMALPSLKENPKPIFPILENLKNDNTKTVRLSVANNLNDISKDNPQIIIDLVKKWLGKTSETDWVLKHASRTLLKQGNLEIMQLFGFSSIENLKIESFKILTPSVKIGEYVEFSFNLLNTASCTSKLRLEYGLYYQKANGSLSRKVFKISEKEYPKNSKTLIKKKQSFKIITTRKFHVGEHQVSIILNGVELDKRSFTLI
ncbi:DNA alkylation repair protein [Lutibacter citreus]|uniref:DNA alkylation repair protein n=1 Tax=Lutibacter citreus TaxID=2138210 RepID=UPI000DBE8D69|nr:DNA alkylation repair protein [Lutibacter citreus]